MIKAKTSCLVSKVMPPVNTDNDRREIAWEEYKANISLAHREQYRKRYQFFLKENYEGWSSEQSSDLAGDVKKEKMEIQFCYPLQSVPAELYINSNTQTHPRRKHTFLSPFCLLEIHFRLTRLSKP